MNTFKRTTLKQFLNKMAKPFFEEEGKKITVMVDRRTDEMTLRLEYLDGTSNERVFTSEVDESISGFVKMMFKKDQIVILSKEYNNNTVLMLDLTDSEKPVKTTL